MVKEEYKTVDIEVIAFDVADVIVTSCELDEEGQIVTG